MKDTHEDLAWAVLRNELLPAWRLYGVNDIEALCISKPVDGQDVALQLRDSRGMRVPRHTIPITLLERTGEALFLLMARSGKEKIVVSVVPKQQMTDDRDRLPS